MKSFKDYHILAIIILFVITGCVPDATPVEELEQSNKLFIDVPNSFDYSTH